MDDIEVRKTIHTLEQRISYYMRYGNFKIVVNKWTWGEGENDVSGYIGPYDSRYDGLSGQESSLLDLMIVTGVTGNVIMDYADSHSEALNKGEWITFRVVP